MSRTLLKYILPLLFLLLSGNSQSYCNATQNDIFHSQTADLTRSFTGQQQNEDPTFLETSASHACKKFVISIAEVEGKEDKQLFPKKHLASNALHANTFDSKTALYFTKSRPRLHKQNLKFSFTVPRYLVLGAFLI